MSSSFPCTACKSAQEDSYSALPCRSLYNLITTNRVVVAIIINSMLVYDIRLSVCARI